MKSTALTSRPMWLLTRFPITYGHRWATTQPGGAQQPLIQRLNGYVAIELNDEFFENLNQSIKTLERNRHLNGVSFRVREAYASRSSRGLDNVLEMLEQERWSVSREQYAQEETFYILEHLPPEFPQDSPDLLMYEEADEFPPHHLRFNVQVSRGNRILADVLELRIVAERSDPFLSITDPHLIHRGWFYSASPVILLRDFEAALMVWPPHWEPILTLASTLRPLCQRLELLPGMIQRDEHPDSLVITNLIAQGEYEGPEPPEDMEEILYRTPCSENFAVLWEVINQLGREAPLIRWVNAEILPALVEIIERRGEQGIADALDIGANATRSPLPPLRMTARFHAGVRTLRIETDEAALIIYSTRPLGTYQEPDLEAVEIEA